MNFIVMMKKTCSSNVKYNVNSLQNKIKSQSKTRLILFLIFLHKATKSI